MAIIYFALNTVEHVRGSTQAHRDFLVLRNELCQFRNDLAIDPNFPIDEMNTRLRGYRQRYSSISSQSGYDIFKTRWLQNQTQAEINHLLADIIEQEDETHV